MVETRLVGQKGELRIVQVIRLDQVGRINGRVTYCSGHSTDDLVGGTNGEFTVHLAQILTS